MLKGHVFKEQVFGNQIFALFINTFLNGKNGISNNYKNGMAITYSGSTLTVDSGAVCIQGRFLEEDTSKDIVTGTDVAYCKLVIEIDLDKENTASEFVQASYKIVKNTSAYPDLTQTDIVKNNSGVYQYELARFKTGASGITDFQDMRTFLDFNSIYSAIKTEYRTVLEELKTELKNVEDGSAYVLNSQLAYLQLHPITKTYEASDDFQQIIAIDSSGNVNIDCANGEAFYFSGNKIIIGTDYINKIKINVNLYVSNLNDISKLDIIIMKNGSRILRSGFKISNQLYGTVAVNNFMVDVKKDDYFEFYIDGYYCEHIIYGDNSYINFERIE